MISVSYIDKLEALTKKMPDIPIHMHNLFSQCHDMMVVTDTNGRFTWVNKYTEILLGYSKDELYEKFFMHFVHIDDVDKTLNIYRDLLNKDGYGLNNFANRYVSKDDKVIHLCWNTTPIIEGYIYCVGRQCCLARSSLPSSI